MSPGFPEIRPRRLRRTAALRELVAETSVEPRRLVLPAFVREGIGEPVPISSMPGVVQHTRDSLRKAAAEAAVDAFRDVADTLFVSVKTIETYREHLKQKLNLKNGPELTRYAIEWSLSQG